MTRVLWTAVYVLGILATSAVAVAWAVGLSRAGW